MGLGGGGGGARRRRSGLCARGTEAQNERRGQYAAGEPIAGLQARRHGLLL